MKSRVVYSTDTPAHNLKVIGSNPGYLLKIFLLYLRLQKRFDPIMPKFVLSSAVRLSSKKNEEKKQRDYLWLKRLKKMKYVPLVFILSIYGLVR